MQEAEVNERDKGYREEEIYEGGDRDASIYPLYYAEGGAAEEEAEKPPQDPPVANTPVDPTNDPLSTYTEAAVAGAGAASDAYYDPTKEYISID